MLGPKFGILGPKTKTKSANQEVVITQDDTRELALPFYTKYPVKLSSFPPKTSWPRLAWKWVKGTFWPCLTPYDTVLIVSWRFHGHTTSCSWLNQIWHFSFLPHFLAEKWLSPRSSVSRIFKKCSKIDFKWLTLRIESFGDFEKKIIFCPGMPGHAQILWCSISREQKFILKNCLRWLISITKDYFSCKNGQNR